MTKQTALFLSSLGHPFLLLPVVLTFLTLRNTPFDQAWPVLSALVGSLLLMTVFLYFRKKKGKISNWDVSAQQERSRNIYLPILSLILLVAALLYIFHQPFVEETLFFGLMMGVCYLINFRVKISQHTLIATYVSWLVIPVKAWLGLGMFLFACLVGWSRVVLGRHQKHEVLLGGAVAVLFGVLHFWLFG